MGEFASSRREKHALGAGAGAGFIAAAAAGTWAADLGVLALLLVVAAALGFGPVRTRGDARFVEQLRQEAHYVLGGAAATGLATLAFRVIIHV